LNPRTLTLGGAALVAILALTLLVWGWSSLHRPYAGWEGARVDVVLEPGMTAGAMLDELADAGVLRYPRLLELWLGWRGGAEGLHAGEYRFDVAISALEVLDRIDRGQVLLHAVTLPEGLVLDEVAKRLVTAGFGTADAYRGLFTTPELIEDLDPAAEDLEGYLFPDTYRFPRDVDAERVVRTMLQRFREVMGPDLPGRAAAAGLDVREVVTLASMIEKETGVAAERARISAVFHNRLRLGMRLQCDPTVIYALRREGRTVPRLLKKHLEIDSAWNTYRVFGLPPGPIANPGRESLEAALAPADADDLYFVASPEGGHHFSTDLESHLQAVAAWRTHLRSSR
jgi:UPF0755 protein